MKKIGLVTVLYNSSKVLDDFFESIKNQEYTNFELYIIDNKSPDDSLEKAKELSKQLNIYFEIIENEGNLGIAEGNNQGIEKALERNCDYVLLLNNDIEFESNVISEILRKSEKENAAISVPKIYFYGTNKIWMAGGKFLNFRGMTSHYGEGNEDIGQFNKEKYVNYAPTCFMLIKKEVFKKVGLMDIKYFVYYDDTDFVYRCNKEGYKILYMPEINIKHKVSTSTGGSTSIFTIFYFYRNRLFFILKNYKGINKLSALFFYNLGIVKAKFKYKKEIYNKVLEAKKDGWRLYNEDSK